MDIQKIATYGTIAVAVVGDWFCGRWWCQIIDQQTGGPAKRAQQQDD